MQPIVIDDPADPRLADYLALNDAALRKATEDRDGVFIAEGITVLRRLITSPYRIRSLVLIPHKLDRLAAELAPIWPADVPVYVASREVLAGVAGFDIHRGVVAAADRGLTPTAIELCSRGERLLVALEGLNDTENLGAIARTARAFGAGGLLLDAACADPLYRRSVRVSMGEILHLPVARSLASAWPADFDAWRAAGYTIAALTPAADAVSIYDWTVPERVVVLLGAEGPGLSAAAQRAADVRLRIPINPSVDSLNVGHAAAAALAVLGRPHLSGTGGDEGRDGSGE